MQFCNIPFSLSAVFDQGTEKGRFFVAWYSPPFLKKLLKSIFNSLMLSFGKNNGLGIPGYGLCMSAEDMAKIGLLFLNRGIYGGRQILSASWIEEMTTPRTVESDHFRGMDYSYLWWIIDRETNIYAASETAAM